MGIWHLSHHNTCHSRPSVIPAKAGIGVNSSENLILNQACPEKILDHFEYSQCKQVQNDMFGVEDDRFTCVKGIYAGDLWRIMRHALREVTFCLIGYNLYIKL